MIPHRLRARDADETIVGLTAAHSVRDQAGRAFVLRKGDTVRSAQIDPLASLGDREIHLVEIEPHELHEHEAGARLASAVAADGIEIRGPVESQYTLAARWRGLYRVDVDALRQINTFDGISVLSRFDYQPVDVGEPVCGVKVTPFAIPRSTIDAIEDLSAARAPLHVAPFRGLRVAAIALERVDARARERFEAALQKKLGWLGSTLVTVRETDGGDTYVPVLREVLSDGPDLILTAGASSIDPLEPLFAALGQLGARIEKHGVPVHPGSLFWIAHAGDVPLLGLSSCEMFSHKTVLDLVLPRLLAGERVDRAELVELGHGGMLGREMAYRFPSYGDRPTVND